MELFVESAYRAIQWLVMGAGSVAWILFLPQVIRIVRMKDAAAMDLKLLFGSMAMQLLLLTFGILQGLVDGVWALVVMYSPAVFTISLLTIVTVEVKAQPGAGGFFTKMVAKLLPGS